MINLAAVVLLTAAMSVFADAADASPQHPPWGDLATNLTTDSLQVTETDNLVDDWLDQCVHPFADLDIISADGGTDHPVSNHQLYNETSGLCMAHVFCAYKECNAGRFTEAYAGANSYNSTLLTDDIWKNPEKKNWKGLNLPAAVVHPRHVGDIAAAIMFASQHNIQLSVKTSGHSYTGASTKDKSLLLNLFRLKQYAHPELEYAITSEEDNSDTNNGASSIVECLYDTLDSSTQDGYRAACALAIARNKAAVIRVGGGETWDLVLKAVSETWNNDPTKSRKYHLMSGAAGTVSAAGGWLASGGLSGNNGMRMYGVGVDQVLHVEMVLPKGMHVRFGPTAWDPKAGMMYPQTKVVTGYCNKGDLEDESAWDWQECDEDISFMDLWYAVRGGGGGSYGVITAIYYQLHEYSKLQIVLDPFPQVQGLFASSPEDAKVLGELWYDFFLKFYFDPAEVGVTEEASNSCSGAASGNAMFCFNDGGDVMIAAWERFCKANSVDYAIPWLYIFEEFDSWFHHVVIEGEKNPNVPPGRGNDAGPLPTIPSLYSNFPDATAEFLMFPQDALVNKRDEVISMLVQCVSQQKCLHSFYIMGGKIPAADDGHNSLPIHRRNGGFLMTVSDNDYRTKFNQLFYGVEDGQAMTGDDFPGALCHNHAGLDYLTPRKDDWTKACDLEYSKEDKEEKCFSFQETAWGTQVLKKLERIHADVDPNRLFSTSDSVGYDDGAVERGPGGTSDGTVLKTSLIACVSSLLSIGLAALWI
jgi:FAD/FMN-containing dehydrogenase